MSLNEHNLASLLGIAPTTRALLDVSFEDLHKVISQIARANPAMEQDIRPVASDKLFANGLSKDVQTLLAAGMTKSERVKSMIDGWYAPLMGDRLAARFAHEYSKFKESGYAPDEIFGALHQFAGGMRRQSPSEEAAVLAILAFLFEKCEIFEASRPSAIQ